MVADSIEIETALKYGTNFAIQTGSSEQINNGTREDQKDTLKKLQAKKANANAKKGPTLTNEEQIQLNELQNIVETNHAHSDNAAFVALLPKKECERLEQKEFDTNAGPEDFRKAVTRPIPAAINLGGKMDRAIDTVQVEYIRQAAIGLRTEEGRKTRIAKGEAYYIIQKALEEYYFNRLPEGRNFISLSKESAKSISDKNPGSKLWDTKWESNEPDYFQINKQYAQAVHDFLYPSDSTSSSIDAKTSGFMPSKSNFTNFEHLQSKFPTMSIENLSVLAEYKHAYILDPENIEKLKEIAAKYKNPDSHHTSAGQENHCQCPHSMDIEPQLDDDMSVDGPGIGSQHLQSDIDMDESDSGTDTSKSQSGKVFPGVIKTGQKAKFGGKTSAKPKTKPQFGESLDEPDAGASSFIQVDASKMPSNLKKSQIESLPLWSRMLDYIWYPFFGDSVSDERETLQDNSYVNNVFSSESSFVQKSDGLLSRCASLSRNRAPSKAKPKAKATTTLGRYFSCGQRNRSYSTECDPESESNANSNESELNDPANSVFLNDPCAAAEAEAKFKDYVINAQNNLISRTSTNMFSRKPPSLEKLILKIFRGQSEITHLNLKSFDRFKTFLPEAHLLRLGSCSSVNFSDSVLFSNTLNNLRRDSYGSGYNQYSQEVTFENWDQIKTHINPTTFSMIDNQLNPILKSGIYMAAEALGNEVLVEFRNKGNFVSLKELPFNIWRQLASNTESPALQRAVNVAASKKTLTPILEAMVRFAFTDILVDKMTKSTAKQISYPSDSSQMSIVKDQIYKSFVSPGSSEFSMLELTLSHLLELSSESNFGFAWNSRSSQIPPSITDIRKWVQSLSYGVRLCLSPGSALSQLRPVLRALGYDSTDFRDHSGIVAQTVSENVFNYEVVGNVYSNLNLDTVISHNSINSGSGKFEKTTTNNTNPTHDHVQEPRITIPKDFNLTKSRLAATIRHIVRTTEHWLSIELRRLLKLRQLQERFGEHIIDKQDDITLLSNTSHDKFGRYIKKAKGAAQIRLLRKDLDVLQQKPILVVAGPHSADRMANGALLDVALHLYSTRTSDGRENTNDTSKPLNRESYGETDRLSGWDADDVDVIPTYKASEKSKLLSLPPELNVIAAKRAKSAPPYVTLLRQYMGLSSAADADDFDMKENQIGKSFIIDIQEEVQSMVKSLDKIARSTAETAMTAAQSGNGLKTGESDTETESRASDISFVNPRAHALFVARKMINYIVSHLHEHDIHRELLSAWETQLDNRATHHGDKHKKELEKKFNKKIVTSDSGSNSDDKISKRSVLFSAPGLDDLNSAKGKGDPLPVKFPQRGSSGYGVLEIGIESAADYLKSKKASGIPSDDSKPQSSDNNSGNNSESLSTFPEDLLRLALSATSGDDLAIQKKLKSKNKALKEKETKNGGMSSNDLSKDVTVFGSQQTDETEESNKIAIDTDSDTTIERLTFKVESVCNPADNLKFQGERYTGNAYKQTSCSTNHHLQLILVGNRMAIINGAAAGIAFPHELLEAIIERIVAGFQEWKKNPKTGDLNNSGETGFEFDDFKSNGSFHLVIGTRVRWEPKETHGLMQVLFHDLQMRYKEYVIARENEAARSSIDFRNRNSMTKHAQENYGTKAELRAPDNSKEKELKPIKADAYRLSWATTEYLMKPLNTESDIDILNRKKMKYDADNNKYSVRTISRMRRIRKLLSRNSNSASLSMVGFGMVRSLAQRQLKLTADLSATSSALDIYPAIEAMFYNLQTPYLPIDNLYSDSQLNEILDKHANPKYWKKLREMQVKQTLVKKNKNSINTGSMCPKSVIKSMSSHSQKDNPTDLYLIDRKEISNSWTPSSTSEWITKGEYIQSSPNVNGNEGIDDGNESEKLLNGNSENSNFDNRQNKNLGWTEQITKTFISATSSLGNFFINGNGGDTQSQTSYVFDAIESPSVSDLTYYTEDVPEIPMDGHFSEYNNIDNRNTSYGDLRKSSRFNTNSKRYLGTIDDLVVDKLRFLPPEN